ncbi:transporter LysE family [Vibrio ponticus]|nr:transporter LysE family [Vibrio ponticus]
MLSQLIAMMIFAIVGAVTPGPVNLIATSTAMNQGMRTALLYVTGASVAYALVVFLSGSLMHSITAALPKLQLAMQSLGSVFILYLAYKIFTAPAADMRTENDKLAGFWSGAVTQIINPKAWLVAISGVSLYVIGQHNQDWMLTSFTTISLFACLLGVGLWAALGRLLTNFLQNSTNQLQFNKVMAGLLAASVSMIWL